MTNEDYARYSGKLAHAQGIMECVRAAINNDYRHKHMAEPLATAIDEVFTVRLILEHEVTSAEPDILDNIDDDGVRYSTDEVLNILKSDLEIERPCHD